MRDVCTVVMLVAALACAAPAQEPGTAAVQPVIEQLRAGLEQHNLQIMLAVFDERRMPNFAQFREQLRAYFQQHDSFRVRTRVLAAESTEESLSSLVEFELEAQPAGGNVPATRKSAQLRIELGRVENGWKIRDLTPRSFFQ